MKKNRHKETIQEIRERLKGDAPQQYIHQLHNDSRRGVKQLLDTYLRRQQKREADQLRLQRMWTFEREYREKGYSFIAGIDEVGRGPLAGPVVAAAVILPSDFDAKGINDSKKLTEDERIRLRVRIEEHALSIGVGLVDVDYIDQHNILQATFEAMRIAISQLNPLPDIILVDAVKIPHLDIPQRNIIRGDELSHSIAAASIVAKTARDEWMRNISFTYPQYGFDQHVGYGTPEHLRAIREYGPTPIHRQSFSPFKEKASI